MTEDERLKIVKAVVLTGMWGHGWIVSSILENLDKTLPAEPSWRLLADTHSKHIQRESVGVLDDEQRLLDYRHRGYWLVNYNTDGCSLFNPPPMNGLAMYVSKRLAEKYPDRSPYADKSIRPGLNRPTEDAANV